MKIRSYIQRRLILFVALLVIGGAIFQVQVFGLENKDSPLGTALEVVSGILVLIGAVGYFVLIKCPRCRNRFGNILAYMSIFSTESKRGINHCPFCGVNFDDEL